MTRELASSGTPGPDTTTSAWQAAKPTVRTSDAGKIAIVPIQGVLTPDGPATYGSNYQDISSSVEQAANDPDVKAIILSVDSPGGQVTGLPETAGVIAAAAKVKPVHAIVEGASASAAYWLTSQASSITVTPSGEVGSVGVRMMHVDLSKALENEGIKITELSAGNYKTEWSPYQPLTEDAQANMNARIQANYRDFVAAVSGGRGTRATAAIKRANFGQGRMLSATDALAAGMVDRLQPTRDFYAGLTRPKALPGRSAQRARLDLEKIRTA